MSVQAYWNAYIPPKPNDEWEYPAMEIAESMNTLAKLERKVSSYSAGTLTSTLRNADGENLELEVSGNIFRMIRFLAMYKELPHPFLIYADTMMEEKAVREELSDIYIHSNVDIEVRKEISGVHQPAQ